MVLITLPVLVQCDHRFHNLLPLLALGEKLLAGGPEEVVDATTVAPAFGALGAAQGELCEALLAWAGEAEARGQPEAVLGEILAGWQ